MSRLESVQSRIAAACREASRPVSEITLLAVSKGHTVSAIQALAGLGLHQFGENYTAEAVDKISQLDESGLTWHFIGPLQSNKSRQVAEHFDWIQSVDRARLADRLSRQRPVTCQPLNVLIQVNIDNEPQKAGVSATQLAPLAEQVSALPGLRLRGLMTIPRYSSTEAEQRNSFLAMRELFEQLRTTHQGIDTLSMGMSADLERAIECGSTMIRVGTALFGPREGQGTR